jgi:hypothetical protein
MKNKKVLLMVTLGILSASLASAQYDADLYSAGDASVDLFGYGAPRNKDGNDVTTWGFGAAGTYFFTRNLGAGVETYVDAFETPYLLNLNATYRYPIQDTPFAVYGFGGFGRQWTHAAQWLGHLGAGVEYRHTSCLGIFTDVREVFAGNTKDYAMVRFGFRFKFR